MSRYSENETQILSSDKIKNLIKKAKERVKANDIILPREHTEKSFPLSLLQQGLWFLSCIDQNSPFYHIPLEVKFIGLFDVEIAKDCLNEIFLRHEILRTKFSIVNGELIQEVANNFSLNILYFDLSDKASSERENEKNKIIMQCATQKFDFNNESLTRLVFCKLENNCHILIFVVHHIIFDGWSVGIFLDEFFKLYNAFYNKKPSPLKPLRIQFSDYSEWQRSHFNNGHLDKQLNYWVEKLQHRDFLIALPSLFNRPKFPTYRGGKIRSTISNDLVNDLKLIAQENAATLFMVMVTALFILLYRYTSQTKINIGCPIANRENTEIESLMGPFINTIVLSADLDGSLTTIELLTQIKKDILDAFANQSVPFEKIVEKMKLEREFSYNPFFQVAFAFQNISWPEFSLHDLQIDAQLIDLKTSKFDLTFQIMEIKNVTELEIEYNSDIFTETMVQQLAEDFVKILNYIKKRPSDEVYKIPLEHKYLIEHYDIKNDLVISPNQLLHENFETQVKNFPNNIALEFENSKLSYQQLDQRCNQLANYLIKLNIGPDNIVGILLPRSAEMIITILAILKTGAAYVPIATDYPKNRIEYIVNDTQMAALITDSQLINELGEGITHTIAIDKIEHELKQQNNFILSRQEITGRNAAYIIYTSGSTGQPKGVINEHRGIVNYINWRLKNYSLTAQDKIIFKTPYTFDVSIWEIFLPLSMGACLSILPPEKHKDSQYLIDYIITHHITVAHFVPSMLRIMLADNQVKNCSSLKQVYCSGEALTLDILELFNQRLTAQLINLYGPTEAAIDVSFWNCDKTANTIFIGQSISNIKLYILDSYMQRVPMGVVGELYIGGIGVARGYLNQPDLTATSFLPDLFSKNLGERLYKTGDLAKLHENGQIEFLGRTDHQVKVRGFRIEVGEIEYLLSQHPMIKTAVVAKQSDPANHDRLVAYCVGTENNTHFNSNELANFLRKNLPEYMVPSLFIEMKSLPLLPNGKIDRKNLPITIQQVNYSLENFILPQSEFQKKLSIIWQELLGVKLISIHDSFFSLGGHSLLAIQLVNKINEKFNINISLTEFLLHPTISQLEELLFTFKNKNFVIEQNLSIMISADKIYKSFPLNDIQQAYWIGRNLEMEMGGVGAHFYLEIQIKNINYEQVNRAVNLLVRRHLMLRTIIQDDGLQKTLEIVPEYVIDFTDLSQKITDLIENELNVIRELNSHRTYITNQFPLFNIHFIKINNEIARLNFSFDLVICDAQSIYIFLNELDQLIKNPDISLPELNFTFRDYVINERNITLHSKKYKSAEKYWKDRISNLPPAPILPINIQAKTLTKIQFRRLASKIVMNDWKKLKVYAAQNNITPSVILLSAFAEILSYWSEQPKFTINLTLFNRFPMHADVRNIIGDFTNLILLEIDCSQNNDFLMQTQNIQKQLWKDLEHRDYNGIQVLREYSRFNNSSMKADMPIVFTSTLTQETGLDASIIDSLGQIVYSISQTPQVYLDHQIYEYNGALHFHWDFVDHLFPEKLVEQMFSAYCQLINKLVVDPQCLSKSLTQISLPHQQLINQLNPIINNTDFQNLSLYSEFLLQKSNNANRTAIFCKDKILSYRELYAQANAIAVYLEERVQPNQLVAVLIEKGCEQIVSVLGIVLSGAAYLPIDISLPNERIKRLLIDGRVSHVITQSKVNFNCPENISVIFIDDFLNNNESPTYFQKNNPNDLAYVIYTSGSTGTPKGVAMEHNAVVNTIIDINQRFNVDCNDKIFAISSLSFDLSVYDIFGLLSVGGSLVLPDSQYILDPAYWLEVLHDQQITIWNSVPILVDLLVDYAISHSKLLPKSLRIIMMSGDWIPIHLPEKIRTISHSQIKIFSLGGATEAAIWSIIYPIEQIEPYWKSIPYGYPLTNQKVFVLDKLLRLRPPLVPGDLYIAGVGLAREYWQNEQATQFSFITHPVTGERLYRTGDKGRYLNDGLIEFLGRMDSQVKIRGFRVELGEIEATLSQHKLIKDSIVRLVEINNKKILTAYVLANQANESIIKELKLFLSNKLPDYMIPSYFFILNSWPLNTNGKIDLKSLPIPSVEQNERSSPNSSKSIITEISGLIHKIMKTDQMTSSGNLLEFGVTSVDIIQIANAMEQKFGFRFKFIDFYRNPSIEGLAEIYTQLIAEKQQTHTSTVSKDYNEIYDLEERAEFQRKRKWHRQEPQGEYKKLLSSIHASFISKFNPWQFQPCRKFNKTLISYELFSSFLQIMYYKNIDGSTSSFYPSFGNLFPIQIYVYCRVNKIAEMAAGIYYYDPLQNALLLITPGEVISNSCYTPFVYSPVFDEAAFAIYLIANLDAIEPIYGEYSQQFCAIEAGYISQLLMMSAADNSLGLHPVGTLDFERIKNDFKLPVNHILQHSLLGGGIDLSDSKRPEGRIENEPVWVEGEI